ncbi:MAG: ExeA family protein [Anaerolineae bacterium]
MARGALAVAQIRTHRGDLTAEKLDRLGFREHPFMISADPRFLYLSKQHLAVLDRVQDVINWREGLAVVEGPVGVGKTTVARRLYDLFAYEAGYRMVYIHTAAYSTATEATRDIASAFGRAPRRAYLDQLRDFERFLVEVRTADENAVVIIDDAQKMKSASLDALQSFFNFDVKVKLIQLILFAQPEIHGTFAQNPAVLDRVASWQRLTPLPPDDAFAMLRFRCQVAGRRESLFTDGAFLRLYEFTAGVPRPMMIISSETLRILVNCGKPLADTPEVDQAIAAYQERHQGDAP